jgi:hypothetical protein
VLGALGGVKDAITSGNVTQIPAAVGNVKDQAGGAVSAMGGDFFPYRRMVTNKLADMAQDNIPNDGSLGNTIYHLAADGGLGAQPDAWIAANQNDPRVIAAREQGYTDPATGKQFAPGDEAAWEAFVSDKPAWERAALDMLYDPATATIVAPAIEGLSEAGHIPQAVGKVTRAVDDVAALGLNQVVEGGLGAAGSVLKKVGVLAPTAKQEVLNDAERGLEGASQLANLRRESGQVADVTSTAVPGRPGVYTLEHPTGLIPPKSVEISGKKLLGVVDDPSNLSSLTRPVAAGEYEHLANLATRLDPQADPNLVDALRGIAQDPHAAGARAYLQTLGHALPPKPGAPLRATIPVPQNATDLLALRTALNSAVAARDAPTAVALIRAARTSNLLPASTSGRAIDVINAIGLANSIAGGPIALDPATMTAVQGTLRRMLDARGLGDIGLSLERVITDVASGAPRPQVEGQYFNTVITLATDLARTTDETELTMRLGDVMNHETIHALRHFNLFQPKEWEALTRYATETGAHGDGASFLSEVTQRYEQAFAGGQIPTLPDAQSMAEEAVAEMFRAHMAGDLVATPVQRTLLEKIAEFFRTAARVIRGVPSGERVLGNVEAGKIAARPRPATTSVMAAAQPKLAERAAPSFDASAYPDGELATARKKGDLGPVKTEAGPSYSITRFTGYHGSPKTDLTVLSPNPPGHQHRTGSVLLGSFVSGDEEMARQYAGLNKIGLAYGHEPGKLYEVDVSLQNPYHMSLSDFVTKFEHEDNIARNDALDFKDWLTSQGHDGIITWDGEPRLLPDGSTDVSDPSKMKEVVLFDETPVKPLYSLAKGQSGVPPTRPGLPVVSGLYPRGGSEEYLGTTLPTDIRKELDVEYSFGGRTEKVWQTVTRFQDSTDRARTLAQKARAVTTPLTPREQRTLDQAVAGIRQFPEHKNLTAEQLANWSDQQVDTFAAHRTARFIEQAGGIRGGTADAVGQLLDPGYYKGLAGKALKAYDNFTNFRRTMSLYSTPRGAQYVLMQSIGNAFTLGIADQGALQYYSPIEAAKIARRGKTGYVPYVEHLRSDVGLGGTTQLGGSRFDQLGGQTFFEKSTNPIVKGIGKIIANPNTKEFADAQDILLRHASYRSAFEPGYGAIRRDLTENAGKALQTSAARAGIPAPLSGDDFAAAIRSLGPHFTGEQLRTALTDSARFGSAAASPVVRGAAERLVRDYVNNVRTLDRFSLANVNRTGFDFAETNADAVLSRLFMFHYWLSRASVLYLNEAAKNPYQLQAWSRAMNAGNSKAQAGWPEWQKNMQEFMRTPAGVTGLWNPAYLVGTYLFFRQDDEMMPWDDLTKLGQATQTGFLSNLMMNPLLQGAIYVLGAGGSDFNPPDLFGTGKWTGDLNTWLEKANRDVVTFYGTEKGNPKVVPNIDGRQLLSWVGGQITQRGWQNDFFGMAPLSSYDPNASEQANMAYFIQDQILTENPGLNNGTQENAKTVASMVEEALANPDSELYQKAADNLVAMYTAGPGSGQGNAALDIAGYYGRQVLPFGITAVGTSRRDRGIRKANDQATPIDTEMGYVDDATPEKRSFDLGYDAYNSAMSPGAKTIKEISDGIKSGTTPTGSVTIDGRVWSDADLAAIPQADRDTLSRYWLLGRNPSMDNKTGQQILDEGYAARDQAISDHPEVGGYFAFNDYIAAYDGGNPIAGIQDTAAINANYRRYLETLPANLTEADYVDKATNPNAYAALMGQKYSTYDPSPMAAGAGQIAGLGDASGLTDWKTSQDEAAHQQRMDNHKEYFSEQFDREVGNFQQATDILNTYDQQVGNAPGTSVNQYAQELQGYTYQGRQVDDALYSVLSQGGMDDAAIAPPNDKVNGYNRISYYLKWAANNGIPPGEQLDEYRYQDSLNYLGGKVADINNGIYSDYTPATDAPPTTAEGLVSDTNIYAQPEKEAPWWQAVGNFLGAAGSVKDTIAGLFGTATAQTTTKEAYMAPASPAPGQPAIDPRLMTTDLTGQQLIASAQEYVGTNYEHNFPDYPTDDPRQTGWDCSSFIHYMADMAGVSEQQYPNDPGYTGGGVPVGSHFQFQWAEANGLNKGTDLSVAQPGDAIYFATDPNREMCDPANYNGCMNNDASHVGLYLGTDPQTGRPLMMHAAAPGVGTVYDYLDGYPYPILGIVSFLPQQQQ